MEPYDSSKGLADNVHTGSLGFEVIESWWGRRVAIWMGRNKHLVVDFRALPHAQNLVCPILPGVLAALLPRLSYLLPSLVNSL